jgi:hypothetical protein
VPAAARESVENARSGTRRRRPHRWGARWCGGGAAMGREEEEAEFDGADEEGGVGLVERGRRRCRWWLRPRRWRPHRSIATLWAASSPSGGVRFFPALCLTIAAAAGLSWGGRRGRFGGRDAGIFAGEEGGGPRAREPVPEGRTERSDRNRSLLGWPAGSFDGLTKFFGLGRTRALANLSCPLKKEGKFDMFSNLKLCST